MSENTVKTQRKKTEDRLNRNVKIRMTDTEYATISEEATARGYKKLSHYLRHIIANRKSPKYVRMTRDEGAELKEIKRLLMEKNESGTLQEMMTLTDAHDRIFKLTDRLLDPKDR